MCDAGPARPGPVSCISAGFDSLFGVYEMSDNQLTSDQQKQVDNLRAILADDDKRRALLASDDKCAALLDRPHLAAILEAAIMENDKATQSAPVDSVDDILSAAAKKPAARKPARKPKRPVLLTRLELVAPETLPAVTAQFRDGVRVVGRAKKRASQLTHAITEYDRDGVIYQRVVLGKNQAAAAFGISADTEGADKWIESFAK